MVERVYRSEGLAVAAPGRCKTQKLENGMKSKTMRRKKEVVVIVTMVHKTRPRHLCSDPVQSHRSYQVLTQLHSVELQLV